MSHNEFTFEQTTVMRQAIDIVLRHLGDSDNNRLRAEIARVVLSIANQGDYDVDTLVMLTIEKLREPARRTS
jgi:hypothetical protein